MHLFLRRMTCALGATLFGAAVFAQELPRDDIRSRESALAEALHAKATDRFDELLAPEFVMRGTPDVSRETWIANAVALCWGSRSDIDEFRVDSRGDVAVATFVMTFYADPKTCASAVNRSLITDVWVRRDGRWQLRMRHSSAGRAESVDSQSSRVPQPPPAWDISTELSAVATSGNASTRTVGASSDVVRRGGDGTSRASLTFLNSAAEGVTNARALTVRARHGVKLSPRIEMFGEGTYARDRFAGLSHRTAMSGGAAFSPGLPAAHVLSLEGGFGYTAERRLDGTDPNFAIATGSVRYAWTMSSGARLTQDLSAIADLETAANWRGTSGTALTVSLSRLLSVKASHLIDYRNQPVPGFGRRDMRTAVALVLSLSRR